MRDGEQRQRVKQNREEQEVRLCKQLKQIEKQQKTKNTLSESGLLYCVPMSLFIEL